MRIVFMGTPEFAVASLDALIAAGRNVVAVVTTPDKPAGRGQKIHQSAVKEYAVERGIPVLQPEKLRDPEFLDQLRSFNADLQVVVAFRMLPEVVWNMPPFGTVNVHASLLPQYRGAAPINHAVINGESESGVTTFLLQHEIDTGNILFATKVPIKEADDAGILHDKLMFAGAALIVRTVDAIEKGSVTPIPQEEVVAGELKHAPKIFKDDCKINWEADVTTIQNFIRGLSPYPAAFTTLDDKVLKVYQSKVLMEESQLPAGSYDTDGKSYLRFRASNGWIDIQKLQLQGKKTMGIEEFLRGYRFTKG